MRKKFSCKYECVSATAKTSHSRRRPADRLLLVISDLGAGRAADGALKAQDHEAYTRAGQADYRGQMLNRRPNIIQLQEMRAFRQPQLDQAKAIIRFKRPYASPSTVRRQPGI